MNLNMECPLCQQDTQAIIVNQTPVIQCLNPQCDAQWDDDGIIRLSPKTPQRQAITTDITGTGQWQQPQPIDLACPYCHQVNLGADSDGDITCHTCWAIWNNHGTWEQTPSPPWMS